MFSFSPIYPSPLLRSTYCVEYMPETAEGRTSISLTGEKTCGNRTEPPTDAILSLLPLPLLIPTELLTTRQLWSQENWARKSAANGAMEVTACSSIYILPLIKRAPVSVLYTMYRGIYI